MSPTYRAEMDQNMLITLILWSLKDYIVRVFNVYSGYWCKIHPVVFFFSLNSFAALMDVIDTQFEILCFEAPVLDVKKPQSRSSRAEPAGPHPVPALV